MEGDSPENDYQEDTCERAPSPDLFSSDDEGNFVDENCPEPSKTLKSSGPNLVLELESARLQRLVGLLQGVPPPPSVTIPQISLNEVLQRLKENVDKMVESGSSGYEPVSSLWKPTASLDEVLKADWPQIKDIVYHDMHFNSCTASEDVEHISMKLHDRFIGAETSSWCNAVTSILPSSAKKRQRRSLGNASPGCRLSHLARRRQTFSSANIAQLSSVAGSGTAGGAPVAGSSMTGSRRRVMNGGNGGQRCIMVEIKKTDKNKRIKTNSKEAMGKLPNLAVNAPSTTAQAQASFGNPKRALFQSPEEQKKCYPASQPAVLESNMALRSKRVLWPSDKEALNDNGKRVLDKSDASSHASKKHCSEDRAPYNRTTRSLSFPLGQNWNSSSTSSSTVPTNNIPPSQNANKSARRASDQGPSSQGHLKVELSELHKRKLCWAILSALRTHTITKSHSDFSSLQSQLALHYVDVRSTMTGPPPASTSEHMLQVVSAKAALILQANHTGNSGQEENLGSGKLQKKEGSGKELFRDATASLNVRRSLGVALSSSNHQLSEDKPKQTKRVPSARKSLSFEGIDPRASSGIANDEAEKPEGKPQLDSIVNDVKWKGNGENVPLACAKRVSRSLFLSPKDDLKAAKKDACEQTCAPEEQAVEPVEGKVDEVKKSIKVETNDADERIQTGSEVSSSIPSNSAASSTLEADNEASRTSDATILSEPSNSMEPPTNLPSTGCNVSAKANGWPEKTNMHTVLDCVKADSGSSESCEYIPTRVLRGTRERVARQTTALPIKRSTRKSLSLCRRELRSNSSDSTDQEQVVETLTVGKALLPIKVTENHCKFSSEIPVNFDPVVVLSPLKVPSPSTSAESNATSKSTFGSPPFIVDSTLTPVQSPFLGFPSKDDPNTSGEAVDESDSIAKAADGSSDEGNLSGRADANLEEKVITPLLEAAVLESSVCVGSASSHSFDADLTFRGRIDCLKPSDASESGINLDLGMNLNVSANLLNMDENREKSPVLEKWAERASRSAQKSCVLSENEEEATAEPEKTSDHPAEESMLPWDESQMEAVSQCSTNMFEKFCSIFDPSSHQGNS